MKTMNIFERTALINELKEKGAILKPKPKCAVYCRCGSVQAEQNRVAIYIRAHEGNGAKKQERICREYAELNGLTVAHIFIDLNVSGIANESSQMKNLMCRAKNGEFGKVIVFRFDRISRNRTLMRDRIVELNGYGGEFISATEGISALDLINTEYIDIMSLFAHKFRNKEEGQ